MSFLMVFGSLWACVSADCHEILYAHSYDRGTSIYIGLKLDLASRQVFAADKCQFWRFSGHFWQLLAHCKRVNDPIALKFGTNLRKIETHEFMKKNSATQ